MKGEQNIYVLCLSKEGPCLADIESGVKCKHIFNNWHIKVIDLLLKRNNFRTFSSISKNGKYILWHYMIFFYYFFFF